MNTENQIGFITSKIEELGTAVLHSHGNSVLNLKSTIVNTMQVDENGHIWFTVARPQQEITQFEKQFPVALNYYKGFPFFLNVFGVARIVADPEELTCAKLNNEINSEIEANQVLLCVKIINANYYEKETVKNASWLTRFKNAFLSIFSFDSDSYYWNQRNETDKTYA